MVQVDLSLNIDLSSVIDTLSPANIERGLFFMIDGQALADTNNYVPLDGTELRQSGHREGASMVWETPYANAQYRGTNGIADFAVYTTPGTGPNWDQVAFASHGEDWINAFLVGAGLK